MNHVGWHTLSHERTGDRLKLFHAWDNLPARLRALTEPVRLNSSTCHKNRAFSTSNNNNAKVLTYLYQCATDQPSAHHMVHCPSSLNLSSTPLLMMYRLCTWFVECWSFNIHKRKTPNGGFTGCLSRTPALMGHVCASVIRNENVIAGKASNTATRSGKTDGNRVLHPYMYWMNLKGENEGTHLFCLLSRFLARLPVLNWTSRC